MRTSAFPCFHRFILLDHKYTIFEAQSRGLHTRYTWLHTHPLGYARRFTTVLLVANHTLMELERYSYPHPLRSNSQFHKSILNPKTLDLTRHDSHLLARS